MSKENKAKDEDYVPRFDLRDGFGKEDIHAIFNALWKIIKILLKIIFFPYFWIGRQTGRLIRFLKIKHDEPLNEDERRFVESVPLFYSSIGVLAAVAVLILLILMWIPRNYDIDFSDLGSIIDGINRILFGKDDEKGIFDYIGDVWGWFADTIVDLGETTFKDPIASLIVFSLIGFLLIIVWFFITEAGVVSRLFSPVLRGIRFVWRGPVVIGTAIAKRYSHANHYLAGVVLGHDRLNTYSQRFWQKVLLGTTLLALWTFIVGVVLTSSFSNEQDWEPWLTALYFSIVLFFCGIVGGVVELGMLSRILGTLSKDKYRLDHET